MYNVEKIKRLLAEKFMTQQAIADATGLSQGTISRLMLTGNARYETARKIAKALNVEPIELIKREE